MNVLLSAPNFQNIEQMIAKSLFEVGCEFQVSHWPDFSSKFFNRFKYSLYNTKCSFNKSLNREEINNIVFNDLLIEYNKKLLHQVFSINPDVLLVLKGDIILPETVEKIRKNSDATLVLWCYDSALRLANVLKSGKYFHYFYTYEPSDISKLYKYNIHANYLPMAYDPYSYFKIENMSNSFERDICFVGVLHDGYIERKILLESIISFYKDLKIEIWGKSWTWYNPFLQYEYHFKRKALGKHINNYNIPPKEVNQIYNTTKICLNIHHRQSKEGVNPRTFEILGSGGFQLVDYKPKLEEMFAIDKEIVFYRNNSDLMEKICYYMENEGERKKIARRGNEVVKKNHTYRQRVETILSSIEVT